VNLKITSDTLESSDLYFAALLLTQGVEFTGTRREGPKAFFQFATTEGEQLAREWIIGATLVDAQSFVSCIKRLKGLVHG
jgi:hypothetical protein